MSIEETTTEQNTEQLDQQQEPQIEYGEAGSQDAEEGESEPSRMESLLDSLTDDGEASAPTEEGQPPQASLSWWPSSAGSPTSPTRSCGCRCSGSAASVSPLPSPDW